jgi:ABC-type nitrate/sulfonate/bicarbonate transport system permease component
VPVVAVAAWWALSEGTSSIYFPPLSRMVSALHEVWLFSHWGSDALPSLENLAVGYLLACACGIVIGTVLGLTPVLAEAVTPVLEFARAIPGVALLPAAILLLGIGAETRISLIVFGTIWPVLLNTVDGVRAIDPAVRDVARSYRISPARRLLRIVLPAASPQIVAGMRTALSIGITVMVFSEMLGTTNGIGFQILSAQRSFAVPQMWAGMIFLGIIGYLLNLGFRGFEHAVLHWHRGMRQTARS